ncbi:MAG: UDP-N-acetylmuramate dehydrogenase [Nitrospirota bacterium]|nr:UDP-N-acetylmuramate dehydrogenase [Nitrospirota bacterium]
MKFREPMRNHTSLRIGGPADIFAMPQDLSSLKNMHINLRRNKIPFFPLGGGTNILVRDGGIEGAVISLRSFRRTGVLSKDNKYAYLFAEAGTLLQRIVNFSKENGYSGVEGLAGIPGTVGGAIFGNAGAFGYEMKDVLISVEVMDIEGRIKRFKAEEINFGYRSTSISQNELILGAEIKLKKDEKEKVSAKVDDFLEEKREKQPLREPSAGCVFKNPAGLSAGKLIDEAGCKGIRIGDVEVSSIHANFFINKGRANASDFIRLMEEVAHRVKERFGVVLEPEIKIVGRDNVNG